MQSLNKANGRQSFTVTDRSHPKVMAYRSIAITVCAVAAALIAFGIVLCVGQRNESDQLEIQKLAVKLSGEDLDELSGIASMELECVNAGSRMITFLATGASCPCLRLETPATLQPSERGIIRIKMQVSPTNQPQEVLGVIQWDNGVARHQTTLRVSSPALEREAIAMSDKADLGVIAPYAMITHTVPLPIDQGVDSPPVVTADVSVPWLKPAIDEGGDGAWELVLRGQVPSLIGKVSSEFRVFVGGTDSSPLVIRVVGEVKGRISIDPSYIVRSSSSVVENTASEIRVDGSSSTGEVDVVARAIVSQGRAPIFSVVDGTHSNEKIVRISSARIEPEAGASRGVIRLFVSFADSDSGPLVEEFAIPYLFFSSN